MIYRIYIRDPHQRVSDKTNTGDRAAALAAFTSLVNRTDLDGTAMLAVLNQNGIPVAHHDFRSRPDGTPHDPTKYWRGRIDQIKFPGLTAKSPRAGSSVAYHCRKCGYVHGSDWLDDGEACPKCMLVQ